MRIKDFDDNEMFTRIADGDETAFKQVFRYYYPLLVSFIYRITHTQHTAEEFAQDVFLRLWQKRNELNEDTRLGAWLYRVASNLAFDYLKKAAHERKLVSHVRRQRDLHNEVEQSAEYRDSKKLLDSTVESLPPQQKLVYRLSREEGLSHQEIAEKLHLSVNTVKNHMVKALETIRTALSRAAHLFFSFFL